MTVKVVLADDHRMLRDALRSILKQEPDIEVVGDAANGREAYAMVQKLKPDVLVMDILMPELNGVDAAARIRSRFPDVKIIALSGYSDKRYVLEMLRAGATGYVIKSAAGTELLRAIRAVAEGRSYLCPEVTAAVVSNAAAPVRESTSALSALGRREREVLQLLAEGMRTPAVADRMSISPATVGVHRRNIMRKLDLHTVAELTKLAVREGLILP